MMKNGLTAGLVWVLVLAGVSAEARLTRLTHVRAESLTALSQAISGVSLAIEQPMIGMMAMGAMQQAAVDQFGTVDQNRPAYVVVYMKGDLPDLRALDVASNPEALLGLVENLAIAVMMPTDDSADVFLRGKGAERTEDGVFKEADQSWWACQDGYAFFATDPEALGESVQELRRGLPARLSGRVMEVVVDRALLDLYADIFASMIQDAQAMDDEVTAFMGPFGDAFKLHQQNQMAWLRDVLQQFQSIAVGMSYDLARGMVFEAEAVAVAASAIAKELANAKPIPPAVMGAIPQNSPFWMAVSGSQDMMGETEKLLSTIRESVLPVIEDEGVRTRIQTILDEGAWMNANLVSMALYLNWDSEGRMVLGSQTRTHDDARAMAAGRTVFGAMMELIETVAPDQTFLRFDADAMQSVFSFEALIDFIEERVGETLPDDDREKVLAVIDALMGRMWVWSGERGPDGIVEILRAQDAAYAPVMRDSDVQWLADGFFAPADARPIQAAGVSLTALIKHATPRVMLAIGEPLVDEWAAVFDAVPDVAQDGMTVVTWVRGDTVGQTLSVSAAELKGLVALVSALGAQSQTCFDFDDWDEDDDV